MAKRGRVPKEIEDFILASAETLMPEDIAVRIDRTPEFVREFIKRNFISTPTKVTSDETEDLKRVLIKNELRDSEAWKLLKEEFTPKEMRYFEESYGKMMNQFRDDVVATEHTQIFDAITLEILKSRNMVDRKKAREDIVRLEKMQDKFLGKFAEDGSDMSDTDRQFALNLESQIQTSRSAEQSRTTEYAKLQERYDSILKQLKGIRDQRVKAFESDKVSFLGLVKQLQNKEAAAHQGRHMELVRIAAVKEYDKLGQMHKYEDGSMDRPILSPETVTKDV